MRRQLAPVDGTAKLFSAPLMRRWRSERSTQMPSATASAVIRTSNVRRLKRGISQRSHDLDSTAEEDAAPPDSLGSIMPPTGNRPDDGRIVGCQAGNCTLQT